MKKELEKGIVRYVVIRNGIVEGWAFSKKKAQAMAYDLEYVWGWDDKLHHYHVEIVEEIMR